MGFSYFGAVTNFKLSSKVKKYIYIYTCIYSLKEYYEIIGMFSV